MKNKIWFIMKHVVKRSYLLLKRSRKVGLRLAVHEWHLSNYPRENLYAVKYNRLGSKNKDLHFGIVRAHPEWIPGAGFCAILNRVLGGLYYADYYGLIPVIDNWNCCAYEEEDQINDTYNVFEYYFEPTSKYKLVDVMQSRNVAIVNDTDMDLVLKECNISQWYRPNEKYIDTLSEIFAKYIRFNIKTLESFENDIKKLKIKDTILGVHYRGSDFKIGISNHPSQYSKEKFVSEIKKIMDEYEFKQVFIATDDSEALAYFVKNIRGVVYYDDVKRTDGKVSVAFLKSERKHNHYMLGYELLRDIYTLAKCDGLVAGLSQVALTARIYKKSKGENYKPLSIIKTSINEKGVNWVEYFKKNLEEKA